MNIIGNKTTVIDIYLGEKEKVIAFDRGRFIHAYNQETFTGISYVYKTAKRDELISISLILGLVANEPLRMRQKVEDLLAIFPEFFGGRAAYVIEQYVTFSDDSVKAKADQKASYISKLRKYKTGKYYVWFNWYDFGLTIATISDEDLDRSEFIRAVQRFFRKTMRQK